jgi:hypothetical protein
MWGQDGVDAENGSIAKYPPASLFPMSNDEQWSPFTPQPPRAATPVDVLWVLTKSPHMQRAELRDFGAIGVELQLYVDDEFVHGRHYEAREFGRNRR